MMDLVWKAWIEHRSLLLGEFVGTEPVPSGWGSLIDGEFAPIDKVDYRLLKEGHLLVRKGTARKALLRGHADGAPLLAHFESEYESPFGHFELQRVLSEQELSEELNRDRPLLSSIWRVKVPRVMYDGPFGRFPWLPDDALFHQMIAIHRNDPEGFASGESPYRLQFGTDITELFEAPSSSYVAYLRSRMGSSWNPNLWSAFSLFERPPS